MKISRLPDPDEVRRLINLGRQRGLIRDANVPTPIEKNGQDVSTLGPLRSQWMEVTPAMAKKWLENNFRNRPLKGDTVKAYARDMALRRWVYTHQGIAFNDKDELIDGQHRLNAIIVSGVEFVRMMVTFGLPSKVEGQEMTTMDAVDRGATRSVGDQLVIQHGFKNGSMTASICAAIGSICFGERTRRLSVGQTLDVFRLFEPAITWVIANRSKEIGIRQTGVMAGFAFAIMADNPTMEGVGSSAVCLMFEKLVMGRERERKSRPKNPSKRWETDSPVMKLRAFLTSDEAKLLTRSLDRGVAELSLQAIMLESEGKPVSKLEMSLAGADRFRAAQPERVKKVAGLFELPGHEAKTRKAA
jgi:hypothetical protein